MFPGGPILIHASELVRCASKEPDDFVAMSDCCKSIKEVRRGLISSALRVIPDGVEPIANIFLPLGVEALLRNEVVDMMLLDVIKQDLLGFIAGKYLISFDALTGTSEYAVCRNYYGEDEPAIDAHYVLLAMPM